MILTTKDKNNIQKVTRYADVMTSVKFEFDIEFSRVTFRKPGTTSCAYFRPEHAGGGREDEEYVAHLALFAYQRLARKHGKAAFSMISRVVLVVDKGIRHNLHLGELLIEHFNKSIPEVIEEALR